MNRAEHIQWAKKRALQYVEHGQISEAYTSFVSDLGKHQETCGHPAIRLGMMLMMGGHLSTAHQMTEFINGTNS